jgi:hypothetical protein
MGQYMRIPLKQLGRERKPARMRYYRCRNRPVGIVVFLRR